MDQMKVDLVWQNMFSREQVKKKILKFYLIFYLTSEQDLLEKCWVKITKNYLRSLLLIRHLQKIIGLEINRKGRCMI